MNIAPKVAVTGAGSFAHALLDPDIAVPAGLAGPGGGPVERRYGVYRNNVVVGLMEALASAFPSTYAVLGEENFARIARNFVALHPPRSPMMQAYGADFPEFLATFPPLRNAPFLADVARVERAFLDAFHAADAPVLVAEELQAISAESVAELSFSIHPATALIASRFPVFDLFSWRNGRPEAELDLGNPQCVAVTRPQFEVEVTLLSACQHAFLASLGAGASFADAAGVALADDPRFDLPGTFALALSAGLFLSNRS
jgi:hypothetical protein